MPINHGDWRSLPRIEASIATADALEKIQFYVPKEGDSVPELRCILYPTPSLIKKEKEGLVRELNNAIQPILRKYSQSLLKAAANEMQRWSDNQPKEPT